MLEVTYTLVAVLTLWLSSRAVGRNKRVVKRGVQKKVEGYTLVWITRGLRKARTIRNRQLAWLALGMISMTIPTARSFDPDVTFYYYIASFVAGLVILSLEMQDFYELVLEEWDWQRIRSQLHEESDDKGNITIPVHAITGDGDGEDDALSD